MTMSFGAVVDPLLATRPPELGVGSPEPSTRPALAAMTVESLFPGRRIVDRSAATACLAGLWLWNDWLDDSHAVSQRIDTPEGSWWHAIMHRREGDFGNAKYWFRRVGDHPLFPRLAAVAAGIASEAGLVDPRHAWIASGGRWDPFRFVDLCENVASRSPPDGAIVRRIAAEEWRLLFSHCRALAVGEPAADERGS